ncbi:MAG: hypothetical protein KDD36_05450 [Flavobacteriales bacterium]|nr:hypothetical protein [Flavobacteriales bacterium]
MKPGTSGNRPPLRLITLILIACASLISYPTFSQDLSTPRSHSPRKAAIFSAVLPGLGQAYNRKYWKIPIVYGGLTGMYFLTRYNHSQYKLYRDEYVARVNQNVSAQDPELSLIPDDGLLAAQDNFRRYRDLDIIVMGLIYGLNIIDATVDAHLYTFDVSDDLSLRWQPSFIPSYGSGFKPLGMALTLRL